jgi:hypothetical protein
MKRYSSLFVFVATVAALLIGPTGAAAAQTVTAGVRGGVSLGWFSGSNWQDYVEASETAFGIDISERPLVSFAGNAYVETMFLRNLGVSVELGYAQLGQSYEYDALGSTVDGTYRQDAFQIPVLVKLSTGRRSGVFLTAGPAFNFLVGDLELEERGLGSTYEVSSEPDNRTVVGLLIGAGGDIEAGPGKVQLELRYARNLTDAFEVNPYDINSFRLVLGYGFFLM